MASVTAVRSAAPFVEARSTGRVGRPAARSAAAATFRCQAAPEQQTAAAASSSAAPGLGRRTVLGAGLAFGAAAATQPSLPAQANRPLSAEWEIVDLPTDKEVLLLDIAFTGSDPLHGFLLGSRQTLLETFDGGKTWAPRTVEAARDEGFNFRFTSISFNGDEGWVVGKPAILLHTTDGGTSWERVPVSAKLPGAPVLITALEGKGCAEMTTDQGAIYVTNNSAMNWIAAVQETVDATLNRVISSGISGASYYEGSFSNVSRNPDGDYVAVSSRGNFFMTWSPGQNYWQPHNRPSTRRLQNMGYTPDNKLWLTTKGGNLYTVDRSGEGEFAEAKIGSRGYGILDLKFADDKIGYACGGSGTLYKTEDGGAVWKREKSADSLDANLYEIILTKGGLGFVLGNNGVLLRLINQA